MLLRLFLFVFIVYLGYRVARRFSDWLLGPPSAPPEQKLSPRKRRQQRKQEIEEARWKDVS